MKDVSAEGRCADAGHRADANRRADADRSADEGRRAEDRREDLPAHASEDRSAHDGDDHSARDSTRDGEDGSARDVRLNLTAFAWEALEEEAGQQGMSVEELVGFSILYYLADRDSGRIARTLPLLTTPPKPGANPLEKLLES